MASNVHFLAQTQSKSLQPALTRSDYNQEQPHIQMKLKTSQTNQEKDLHDMESRYKETKR